MTQPNWSELVRGVTLRARSDGLWTKVWDYVAGPRRLRIVANGRWTLVTNPATQCGPEGNPVSGVAGLLLLPTALAGSLVAKIGGGTSDYWVPAAGASTPATPTSILIFPVGSFCTIDIPQTVSGALFLTMNDAPAGFPNHDGTITVDIYESWS